MAAPFDRHHSLPRAGLDPIDHPSTALDLVRLVAHHPPRSETIAVLLDDAHRGIAIVVVGGTERPDDVIGVVECLSRAERCEALIVASIRPDRPDPLDPDDPERWLEASDLAEQGGAELVEWFVLGPAGAVCPRDLLGVPPRWAA